MITEKTMMTWLAEFNKLGNNPHQAVEYLTRIQGEFVESEPMAVAMLSQLFGALKIENPLSAAIMALGIFMDCKRRQDESDELSNKTC